MRIILNETQPAIPLCHIVVAYCWVCYTASQRDVGAWLEGVRCSGDGWAGLLLLFGDFRLFVSVPADGRVLESLVTMLTKTISASKFHTIPM